MTGRLGHELDAALTRFGRDVATIDAQGALRFADLDRAADAIAAGLAGGAPHEPVIVQVANRAVDLAAFLGVWRAGCVVVPAHRTMPDAVRDALVRTTGARAMVDGGAAQPVRLVADRPPPDRPLLRDAAFVIFTSGSSGQPKGVVLGHDAFADKLAAIDSWLGFGRTSRVLLVLQITFSFGIWNALLTVLRGGLLMLEEKFEPDATIATINRHGVTVAALVPTMLRALLARFADDAPLASSLRQILTGGEPLSAGLTEPLARRFPGAELLDIYGLTETSTCDLLLASTSDARDPQVLGRPTPRVACRIVDADGHPAADDAIGELELRSDFVMRGYLDAPDLTSAAFRDGWLRTGDLARRAVDGRISLAGRAKELIVRGANKIAPLEIEQAMQRHPEVAAALATGVTDALMGERIHLLVLARTGGRPSDASLRADLHDWATRHLERYKRPDVIHFADALPVGRTGKADRAQLRALIESGALDARGPL